MNDPVLAQALAALDSADVAVSDDAGCTDLLGATRKVRGWVDAVEARGTSRMRELHATAGAAPAADRHTRCGGVPLFVSHPDVPPDRPRHQQRKRRAAA